MNRNEKIAYFTLHAKEHKLNIIETPIANELPSVGERIKVKATQKKGNEKVLDIECIVKEDYPGVIRVEVIKKVKSRVSNNCYTYSECFRKLDFESGFLKYEHVGEVL